MKKKIVVYQGKDGAIKLKGDFEKETIWATQIQIAALFDVERSVVTKHISNILRDKELNRNSVCANFAHTAEDGKIYKVQYYNLDVILAVGYRTSSLRAIQFRQWATSTLREHIVKGYTINRKRISKNYEEFLRAVKSVQKLLPKDSRMKANDVLDLIKMFAGTWFSLNAYDKSSLPRSGVTRKTVKVTAVELTSALMELRRNLIEKKEASELFARELQNNSVAGIMGNIFQSVFGGDVYKTLEEKAAHLLYFTVKDHPFTDGNKRSGAFTFVWFLSRAGILRQSKISPKALTALTLLVAESNPKDKERMVGLILMMLKSKNGDE